MMLKNTSKFKTIAIATVLSVAGVISLTGSVNAAGYFVNTYATTSNFHPSDTLSVRAWPAAHSRKLSQIRLGKEVFVERCIIKNGADWCKIQKGWKSGWVNGRFIFSDGQTFRAPHHAAYDWH
ncbi:MAG: hypothetical protein ABJN26_14210 [Stappiaceae bacterium]